MTEGIDYDSDYSWNNNKQDNDYKYEERDDIEYNEEVDDKELNKLLSNENETENNKKEVMIGVVSNLSDSNTNDDESQEVNAESSTDKNSINEVIADMENIIKQGSELIEDTHKENNEEEEEPQLHRSSWNRREVERLTYAQVARAERYNLFTQSDLATKLEYSMEEAKVLGDMIEHIWQDDTENKFVLNHVSNTKQGVYVQQYTLNKGLKKFGEAGRAAASKEMKQLHNRECFRPLQVNEMTTDEK